MELNECIEKGIVRKTRKDTHLVRSLLEMSKIKESIVKPIHLDQTNIQGYYPMAYDSLRELMEAICILDEKKVTNHECLGKQLKHLHPDFDIYLFERLRIARNGINYYGAIIDLEQGKKFIEYIFDLNSQLRQIITSLLTL